MSDSFKKVLAKGLPDYDAVQADTMLFGAWFGPEPTLERFQELKDCGFNTLFLLGDYTGWIGDESIEKALALCDKLGIDAFVDGTRQEEKMRNLIAKYKQYASFKGFNYDEPVIYDNTLTRSKGLVSLSSLAEEMVTAYPDLEFLVNLNPYTSLDFAWGTPAFTYEEYLEATDKYINQHYKNKPARRWISVDDYPLFIDKKNNSCCLKKVWLKQLEYLAEEKRKSPLQLTSNFFIQSMAFGAVTEECSNDRLPTYEDLRLQVYSVMAFGYDMISFFCYAMPLGFDEFTDAQYGLLNKAGDKTQIYTDSKRIIGEVKKFSNTYMQFNSGWQGVLPVLGTNNPNGKNPAFDELLNPITSVQAVKGLASVTSSEDIIIGVMQDKDGRPGYMLVNYNDSSLQLTSTVEFVLDGFDSARVYIQGEAREITAVKGKITLELDIGEGVFVIPYNP